MIQDCAQSGTLSSKNAGQGWPENPKQPSEKDGNGSTVAGNPACRTPSIKAYLPLHGLWPARGLVPKGICSVHNGAAFNALYVSGQPIYHLPLPRFRLRPSVKPVALFTHECQWSSRRSAHFGDSHCKHIIGLYCKAITIVTTGTWR
jgi:hypothetical protein